ncbi:MAG: hypothetical protein NTY01_12260 [Verrucomicrobia bacterium]|nr:hypothetical protein [Verrucomicrobiota bacterium]
MEQRIEELKSDLAAESFCMQSFFATESAFLAVLLSFNLLSLYQRQIVPGGAGIGDQRRCGLRCFCAGQCW